jgi:hypothetical protein
MNDQLKMDSRKTGGAVECLGMTFPSEEARREHFLGLLAEKLKDPAFRKQEGFPQGTDEAILAMSDPPYYTACPNPWLGEFAGLANKRQDDSAHYKSEPFVADVSEGKNDPIYNAHGYHTKAPHRAIMRYILHFTQPGDVVLDGFCGTGMTGIAAQLCADRRTVTSLGYRVDGQGNILEQVLENGTSAWKPFSTLGKRRAILNDLSPAASFIAHNYNTYVDFQTFSSEANEILSDVEKDCGWMYETLHSDGRSTGKINFTVWSDVFHCPECAEEIIFWRDAVDKDAGKALEKFPCPGCSAELSKRNLDRSYSTRLDGLLGERINQARQVPVLINYSVNGKRYEKTPDANDLKKIETISNMELPAWAPSFRMMEGSETRRNDPIGVTHTHHFYTQRNLYVLSLLKKKIFEKDRRYGFWFTSALNWVGKENRLHLGNYFGGGGGVITSLRGTWYISSLSVETSVLERFALRTRAMKVRSDFGIGDTITSCGSFSQVDLPSESVDYIFVDPPFGGNLMYAQLNFLQEAWLGVTTNHELEAVEDRKGGKTLDHYRQIMTRSFKEAHRVLKPGRWITVEFSNTQAAVWNAIQIAMQESGFVVANVSALDKGKGSFKAVNTTTAVKQDLVISAYKPDGALESRLSTNGGSEASVWDFVETHLGQLPISKSRSDVLDFIIERDARILFDRTVAWFVRHNVPVPLSTQEFQEGLRQRFVERDGMIFLSHQVSEYDRKRAIASVAPQMELFVSDERSAIDWLTDFLKKRPSTYQELQPEFFGQLGAGWRKHEARPELSSLLEDNFLEYSGDGDVPSQIHSYLSTNFKDLRGLDKDDSRLKAKAKDRWYVPDPSKAKDLEQKRERSLLKEFESYKSAPGRRLKEFRLEVLRAGFKTAWAAKDYKTIIGIAQKIPEEALQEDEKLLLWYDQALTRMEADA